MNEDISEDISEEAVENDAQFWADNGANGVARMLRALRAALTLAESKLAASEARVGELSVDADRYQHIRTAMFCDWAFMRDLVNRTANEAEFDAKVDASRAILAKARKGKGEK